MTRAPDIEPRSDRISALFRYADARIVALGLAVGACYWVLEALMDHLLFDKGPFLQRLLRPDLMELWMRLSVLILLMTAWLVVHFLYSDLKQSRERLHASLQEKEVLLREVHHRVKNNLQIVSTLLDLQSKKILDPRDLTTFRESQNRVRAMAMIHEKLYGSKSLARIDLPAYLVSLSAYLFEAYGVSREAVHLRLDTEDISLNLDKAVPCGLILNELLSNALKHAFPEGRQGCVRIEVVHAQGRAVRLSVSDDGVGLPPGFDLLHTKSLGLHLVSTLARQLRGALNYTGDGGTRYSVTFEP